MHISCKEAGLRSPRDLILLTMLSKHPTCQGHLTKILPINAPTLSKQVDALVQSGLVERMANEQDRRSQVLSITKDGIAMLDTVRKLHQELLAQKLSDASDEDLALIIQATDKLIQLTLGDEHVKNIQKL